MADGTHFELSNELFHIIKDITNIQGLGWQLKGNILERFIRRRIKRMRK